MGESAAEKQKRLMQQEIAKLSGKLTSYDLKKQQLINQGPSPDMVDLQDQLRTPPLNDHTRTHMHQEAHQSEEEVGEEEEAEVATHLT
jgi:hypothetical protein